MKDCIVTTDLSDLRNREREEAIEILQAWNRHGLPAKFSRDEVHFMLNKNSGFVFLTNSDFETAMLKDGKLQIWHHCPNCSREGFEEDCKIIDEECNLCRNQSEN